MQMKNFFRTAACAVLFLSLAASCNRNAGPMKTDSFQREDSTAHVRLSFDIELPAGNTPVSGTVRTKLLEILDSRLGFATSYEGDRIVPAFSGDKAGTDAVAGHYFTGLLSALGKQADADVAERLSYMQEDESFTEEDKANFLAEVPGWEYEYTLKKVDETPGYVIFQSQDYTYLGGAHGGVGGDGCLTFSMKDGSFVGHLVDRSQEKAMQPLLIAGMLRYYKEFDVEMTQDELLDNLMIEDRTIPLPGWEPYPTADGLVFTYQQYEIASYAEGMPSFTVPFDEITPFLTPEAKAILSTAK